MPQDKITKSDALVVYVNGAESLMICLISPAISQFALLVK